jgi:antitoxin ParD1/3/4
MQKNTSVTLGAHYEKFISQQVLYGRFGSASETIRAGLRLLEERETKQLLLRQALIKGEESGTADYSLQSLIDEIDGETQFAPSRCAMQKARINITLDADLIDFIKEYAETQRTTVSEVFTPFVLKLKRLKENDPTETILADPDFSESLLQTIDRVKAGTVSWHSYDEVFK